MDTGDRTPQGWSAEAEGLGPTSTVGEFLEDWLAGKRPHRVSTYAFHEAHVRRFLVPYLGKLRLDGLRAAHIERMYVFLAQNDDHGASLSVPALAGISATLTSALNTAVHRGLLDNNPAARAGLLGPARAVHGRPEEEVKTSPHPQIFTGMVRVNGEKETVTIEADSWADAIERLDHHYGRDSEFVLRPTA
jgi:hypothetical protein